MKPFLMEMEYLDSETGEMVTENILIDDFSYSEAEPFTPEPDNDTEFPF